MDRETYLDESWPCCLHRVDEKAVPPDSAPCLSAILPVRLTDEEHGTGYYHRNKKGKEVYETPGSQERFPDLVAEKDRQSGHERAMGLVRGEDGGLQVRRRRGGRGTWDQRGGGEQGGQKRLWRGGEAEGEAASHGDEPEQGRAGREATGREGGMADQSPWRDQA